MCKLNDTFDSNDGELNQKSRDCGGHISTQSYSSVNILQLLCLIFSLCDLMRHFTRVWDIPLYFMAIEFYTLTLCRFRVWHWIANIFFRYIMYSKANNIDGIAGEFDPKYPKNLMPFELSNSLNSQSVLQY